MCICGVRIQCFQLELLKVFDVWTNYKCFSCKYYIPLAKNVALHYTYAKMCPAVEMAILLLACVWMRISCVLLHLWCFPPAPSVEFTVWLVTMCNCKSYSAVFGPKSRMLSTLPSPPSTSSCLLRFVWCLFSLLSVRDPLSARLHNFISLADGNVSLRHRLLSLTHLC
jgi:hypothetical protein